VKKRNKWLSGVLASSLVLSQIVTTIPMSVIAAPERAVADGVQQERAVVEMWRQFKSSTKNDNGNNAAILVNTNKGTEGMEAGEISFVLKPNGDQANEIQCRSVDYGQRSLHDYRLQCNGVVL